MNSQDRPGRWRCPLCPTRHDRRWRPGTLRQASDHYRILHTGQETR